MLHNKAPPYRQRPLLFLTNCFSLWPVCCKLSYTHKGSSSLCTRHLFTTCSYVWVLYLTCQLQSVDAPIGGVVPHSTETLSFFYSQRFPPGFSVTSMILCVLLIFSIYIVLFISDYMLPHWSWYVLYAWATCSRHQPIDSASWMHMQW